MKVVLSVRSDIAYELLTKLLSREKRLPELEFQKRNSKSVRDLEDAIEFYRADVYVVDMQLEEAESLVMMLKSLELTYVVIENDIKSILPVFVDKFGVVEEKVEIHYEREEKERIVVQEKIIEKEIIRTAYQAIPSKVVVVGSLYRGAGSTILATNLARMTSERGIDVAYVEHPLIRPYMFDYLQIDHETKMDENKAYVDIASEIQREGIARGKSNAFVREGIKWHVNDSRIPPVKSFSYENLLALSHAIQSSVLIIDISDRWLDPEVQKFLYLADSILMCVEPDPIKYEWSLYTDGEYMQRERKTMEWLMENKELNNFELVLMKNIKGIDIKMLKSIMHKKPIVSLPYIPYSEIQQALYKSKLIYDFEQNKNMFEDSLMKVLPMFLPKDFISLNKRRNRLLNLINRKK
ncbi:MAG: hypothetical protein N2A99_06445 [Carnobacterium alterfunditum]